MADLIAFLAVAGGLATVLAAVARLGARIRRRGIGGGLMGPIDEMYNPAAHRARLDIQTHEERTVPMPSPDDRWRRIRARPPERGDGPGASDPPPQDAGRTEGWNSTCSNVNTDPEP